MAKQAQTTRAPRGTKILIKAFFDAADQIPEPQRADVVKAALGGIREQIAAMREKQKAAKLKARGTAARTPRKATLAKPGPKKGATKSAARQTGGKGRTDAAPAEDAPLPTQDAT